MLKRFIAPGLLACAAPMTWAVADDPKTGSADDGAPQIVVVRSDVKMVDDQKGEEGQTKKSNVIVLEKAAGAPSGDGQAQHTEVIVTGSLLGDNLGHVNNITSAPLPKLWLGIGSKKIEGDLATFLGGETGVFVDHVQTGSPAEKAGIRSADVILAVDGNAVTDTSDLLKALETASADKALVLKVQRKVEQLEVSVIPQPRPETHSLQGDPPLSLRIVSGDRKEGEGSFSLGFSEGSPDVKFLYRLGDPAAIRVTPRLELKGDITIQLSKEEDGKQVEVNVTRNKGKAATITVVRGEEVQTFTEDQLDELPEDVKDWVKSSLNGTSNPGWFSVQDLAKIGDEGTGEIAKLRGMNIDLLDLKGLAKLADSEAIQESKAELEKMVAEIVSSSKAQAHEAFKHALEQAKLSAGEAEAVAKQHAKQAGEIAKQHAEHARKVAKQHAEEAKKGAYAWAEVAKGKAAIDEQKGHGREEHATQQQTQSQQIAELKALVEQLRKEIAELRSDK